MEREKKEYKYMVVTRCFTFNHAPYIVDAMKGFAMQETTFPVITLIMDDASTDGEPDVIRQYLTGHFQKPYRTEDNNDYQLICANHKSNPNCKFIVFLLKYNHQSIKKSKFPYLSEWLDNTKYQAMCEGDDYWIHPKKLQMQVDYMECHEDCGLVHGKASVYDEESGMISDKLRGRNFDSFSQLIRSNHVITLTTCFRESAFKKYIEEYSKWISDYNLTMLDYSIWLWISRYYKSYFIEEITGVYRILHESASHSMNYNKMNWFIDNIYAIQRCYADKFDVSNDVKKDIYNNYIKAKINALYLCKRYREAYKEIPKLRIRDRLRYYLRTVLKIWGY